MASETEELKFSFYLIVFKYDLDLSSNMRLVASILDGAVVGNES